MNAFVVVSDSGTLPKESSFYASVGKPIAAVCIRTSTERPEALDKACFVLAGIDEKNLMQAVKVALLNKNGCCPVPDYIDMSEVLKNKTLGRVSDKERIIAYNVGIAIHDVMFAESIYEAVIKKENSDKKVD